MQQQQSSGAQESLDDIARRHGFGRGAVDSMLESVRRGHGTMAQFSHPEFSGSGQWMRGGMTMVSDMFNKTLASRVDALCTDLATHPYEPTETAHRVRSAIAAEPGVDVSLRDVVFILRGMQLNGHVFGRGGDDARTLAQRLCNQVMFLCQREQMVIDEASKTQIRQWIGGDLLA